MIFYDYLMLSSSGTHAQTLYGALTTYLRCNFGLLIHPTGRFVCIRVKILFFRQNRSPPTFQILPKIAFGNPQMLPKYRFGNPQKNFAVRLRGAFGAAPFFLHVAAPSAPLRFALSFTTSRRLRRRSVAVPDFAPPSAALSNRCRAACGGAPCRPIVYYGLYYRFRTIGRITYSSMHPSAPHRIPPTSWRSTTRL